MTVTDALKRHDVRCKSSPAQLLYYVVPTGKNISRKARIHEK